MDYDVVVVGAGNAAMCSALAEQTPWWTPDTGHGYHTNTIGFLLGELVRRVTGRRIGMVIREDIAEPLGAEFFVGLGEEYDNRTAEWISYKPLKDEVVPDRQPWKKFKYEEATHLQRMSISSKYSFMTKH